VLHRVGDLRIGEIAVGVAVASPHRAQAFDACEYTIDELKSRAPIWKKEHYADGSGEWKENACRTDARPR
jgi:molybdopterin synthase catalytic subunit